MLSNSIKAIFFDADGVVILAPQIFSKTLENKYGLSSNQTIEFFTGPFQKCLIGQSDLKQELLPYLQQWNLDMNLEEFLTLWFESENHPNQIMIQYVSMLKTAGLSCYLATNQERYRAQFMRNQMGLGDVFDDIFSSADLGLKKPDPLFFQELLNKVGLNASEVLFIDDAVENVEAAESVGIRSYTFENQPALEKFIANHRS